ncbi:arylesterase [Acidovorax sp. PRC11]|uniref:arylesterase n=1 Tax=Acidovorax sp. PRC11 TaxID=2962592 RepID=UPI00288235AA|nr:arylesterase [Acidovorax sp. PRC11]MDT0138496.1 arylesterase [Acidovorax sp. PRC11]
MRFDAFRRDFIVAAMGAWALGLCMPSAGAQPAPAGGKPVILVVGDSLSAEYGLARGTGWVALLEKKLAAEKISATVVNASVSGDTTAGGRSRLPALLTQHRPTHVVLELGGNDALRGLPMQGTEANLRAMAEASKKAGAQVLVVGMQVPPNYGSDYTRRFEKVFAAVAEATGAGLVPFLLKGVADRPDAAALFQADRIHPRAEAQPAMLANVWSELRKLLR